ncbi:hypothetical protein [Brenneria izadpanahii]|nr:hypothetical protein [Brenneria izadpanahii]
MSRVIPVNGQRPRLLYFVLHFLRQQGAFFAQQAFSLHAEDLS